MRRAKNNCRLISKKCLILSVLLAVTVASSPAISSAIAAIEKVSVDTYLRSDLTSFRKEKLTDFKSLIQKWERVYGEAALPALNRISRDGKSNDADRYS